MDKIYCQAPDYTVLKNIPGYTDPAQLDTYERRVTRERAKEAIPGGNFDIKHIQAIHKHLFQDVYEWAGEFRTLEIAKGHTQFMPKSYIETGLNDIHQRLARMDYLRKSTPDQFAKGASEIIGDLNHVHPFREGNGRVMGVYLKELGRQAGHKIDLTKIDKDQWIAASIAAHNVDYLKMQGVIKSAIEPMSQEKSQKQSKPKPKGLGL